MTPDAFDQQTAPRSDSVGLLDAALFVVRHKWMIVTFPLCVGGLAAGYSFYLPNIYTATTKILPPQQSQSTAAALLSQLGGLGGLAGGKSPNDVYLSMLKSRTVADGMIARFHLHPEGQTHPHSKTREELAGRTKITSGLDGVITVEVDDSDPQRAADLANGYVEELIKLTGVLAVTEASKRRLFFEGQFRSAKEQLAKAETQARQAIQTGGVAHVEGQARALLEAGARIRGQVAVKEIQIAAMRSFATDSNPELRFAQQELEAMKRELSRIEGASGGGASKGRADGAGGLDSQQLLRNVKYYETIYELLAKQYEMAKIDEAKEGTVIQVLDKAISPDTKSKPRRRVIVQIATLIALVFGIFVSVLREKVNGSLKDPAAEKQWQELRRHLKLGWGR